MVIRTNGRRPLISTSKDYTLTSSLVRDLKKLTALDLSFQSEERWDSQQKSKYITSLILGMAPSKVILANISDCLSNSQADSWDFMYFNNWKQKGFENISIDGNNRTITIDEYMNGKVSIIHDDYEMPNGQIVVIDEKSDTWIKHPSVFRKHIEENIFLTVTEYKNATRQNLTDLFISINDGITLNAQELRNAILVPYAEWVRKMTLLTYNDMLVKVFPTIKQKVRRTVDDFIVSMSIFTTYGTIKSIQGAEKNSAYEDDSTVSQKVQLERAEKLLKSFVSFVKNNCGEEMKNHSTLFNLFMIYTYLLDHEYIIKNDKTFYEWFMSSENKRVSNTNVIMTTAGGESKTYQSCNSTMSSPELTARYKLLIKDLSLVIDVHADKKDKIRLFSPQERYKLWERQKGICTKTGKSIPEFEINDDTKWHADHIVPYSKGGKTVIENGQLIDKLSNLQKSNKLPIIR